MPRSEISPSNRAADVVVVGGGVIGLSIARALVQRGLHDVTLIDRGALGAEASWAAGGILAPQVEADRADEFFRLACASRDMYPALAAALLEESGIDVELDKTGTLYLGFTSDEEQEMRRRYEWQSAEGLSLEWLTGDEARQLEPNISADVLSALRFPNDYQVENRRLVEALAASNKKLGVRTLTDCEVLSLRIEQERVAGVETAKGFFAASAVVIAAGAWTSQIRIDDSGSAINVEPVRGQMLCFETHSEIARHVIYSSRGYLVPRRDGRLLAGSTTERVGFDKRVTDEGTRAIMSMACEIAPSLEHLPLLNSWAGFRPHVEDDLPVIGRDPEVEGLFYATGHYRNGILLAPATAELTADSISGGQPRIPGSFSPNRFRTVAVCT
jgi:glycine oxidase